MTEYVHLGHEDCPEWFTLDLARVSDNPVPLLILGIVEEPLHRLVVELPKYRALGACKELLKECGAEIDFLFDIDKPWGFGGVLEPYQRANRDGRYKLIEYAVSIPQVEKDAGACRDCNGKNKDDYGDCLHCMGTGRETVLERAGVDRIAATLCVLASVTEFPKKELVAGINTKQQQLLSLKMGFGWGRAYIGADLSSTFSDYLRRISGQGLPAVEAAIKSIYLHMFPGYKKFADFSFRANVRNGGQLIIDVPGDACGLYVDGFSRSLTDPSEAMKLDCHNVDGHHQQLTLLCGLAAVSGMARKNLYPDA